MRTKNLNNIMILSASNAVLHILGIIYHMIITRLGGAEGMGVLQLVMPFYGLMRSISLSGSTVAVSRLTAEGKGSDGGRRLVWAAILLFLFMFVLLAVPTWFLADNIAMRLLGDARTTPALRLMLACLLFTGFENIFKAYFYGKEKVTAPIISDITEQLVRICAVSVLLAKYRTGDNSRVAVLVLCAMICSELVSSSLMMCFYKRLRVGVGSAQKKYTALVRSILTIAVPISAGGLLDNLLGTASTLVLPRRLVVSGMTTQESIEALGILHGMVMPVMALPIIFIGALCTITLPSVASSYASGNYAEARRKTVRAFTATGLLTFPLTGILVSIGADLCYAIYHQHGIQSYIVPLALSSVFLYFHMVAISVLNSIGKQKESNICSVVCGALELLLIILLAGLPRLGIYGYIAARIIGGTISTSVCILMLKHFLGLTMSAFKSLVFAVLPAVFITLVAEVLFKTTGSLLLSASVALCAYGFMIRKLV